MILRTITLILLGVVLFFKQGHSQQEKSRESIQTSFVINNFILNKKKINIRTTAQVDSLLGLIEQSWKRYVQDSLGTSKINSIALNNVGAYVYMLSLFSATGKMDIDDEIDAYLTSHYMLPSILKDYELIKVDPRIENVTLIGRPAINNIVQRAAKHYKTIDFMAFYKFYAGFRSMQQALALTNASISKHIGRLMSDVEEFDNDIEAKYFFLSKQPELAFGRFITGLSVNNYYKPYAVKFGVDLLRYFGQTKETDKALTVLNTLMLYTTADDLSRDSLSHWYTQADPVRGEKIYGLTKQKISGNTFKTGDVVGFKIPAKWNLLNDPGFVSKIAAAKYFIVDFWYTKCGPCIAEIPKLNELANSLKNRQDIVFFSINADYSNGGYNEDYVRKFMKENEIGFPVVYDTETTAFNKQLEVYGYPRKFILDNKGRIISKIDDSQTTLETLKEFLKTGALR